MSQMPPPGVGPEDFAPMGVPQQQRAAQGTQQPQRRTNGWAIASLVSGLLGCVPFAAGIIAVVTGIIGFATGVVAVVTGIIGIRTANDPRYTGRGLAIGGLVLGVLGMVIWAFLATALIGLLGPTGEPRKLAQEFIRMTSEGAIDAALEHASPSIGRGELDRLARQMEPWGEYQDVTSYSSSINVAGGVTSCDLKGAATFADGEHPFAMTLIKQADAWKVSGLEFE